MTFNRLFTDAARRFPGRKAVLDRHASLTYGELDRQSAGLAASLLRLGLGTGDRVALLMDSSAAYCVAYLGILRSGCAAVPMNTDNSRRSIHHVLGQCTPKCIIAAGKYLDRYGLWDDAARSGTPVISMGQTRAGAPTWEDAIGSEAADPLPETTPSHLACILFTSGTTGSPKGVMLSQGNIAANTQSIVSYLNLTEQDSVLAVLPFSYSYGSSLLHTHLAVGGTVHVEGQFVYPNTALERMAKERITGFAGVPSTFALLLHRSNFRTMQWPHLRYVTQAGGAMAPALARELKEALPGTDIYIMYGQTEATARLSYLPPAQLLRRPDSIGTAIPGVELRVVDPEGRPVPPGETGEIIARGANVMQGYWGLPEETALVLQNGWLHTGDMARIDEEGFLYIVSRKSDLIKTGAHRVSPKEIEDVISSHPSVHEAAVVGEPDAILGERICAFVVPRDQEVLDERDLIRHCRRELASFKVPQEIIQLDALPKTSSGKVKKFLLREESAPQRHKSDVVRRWE